MSTLHYLEYFAYLKGIDPAAQSREAMLAALAAVGLEDKARTRVSGLSGGMVRRLGLAVARLGTGDRPRAVPPATAPSLLTLGSLSLSLESLEETSRRRMVGLRTLHVLSLLAASGGGAVLSAVVGPDVAHVYLLNALHLVGLTVLCTALMGAETGWLPVLGPGRVTRRV